MKKSIFMSMLIVLLISCQTAEKRYTQQSSQIETTKAVINDYNNQNWDAIAGHYADTAKIYFNTKDNFMTPSQLAESHKANDENFVSRGIELEEQEYEMVVTDDGNTWVNFWGTWKGTMSITNEELLIPVHVTQRFVDGKVVEEHGLWDNSLLVAAVQKMENAKTQVEGYQTNAEIIKLCYKLFAEGDVDTFLTYLDPKVEWNEAENFIYSSDGPLIGPDAFVKEVLEPIGNDWEYWKIAELKVHEMANGFILGTGRYQGKHKTTGKVINAQLAHLFTLKNSKIIRFQQYTDTKQISESVK